MNTHTTLLDADRDDAIRMTPDEAFALGMGALKRLGYSDENAKIIVDQLIDNALCGYRFASLPRILAIAGDEKLHRSKKPVTIVHETPLSALLDGVTTWATSLATRAPNWP